MKCESMYFYLERVERERERERERTGRENCVSHTDRQANFQRRPNIYKISNVLL